MTGNKEAIDKKFVKDKDSELLSARHAWRSLLVPAVGSAAFFA